MHFTVFATIHSFYLSLVFVFIFSNLNKFFNEGKNTKILGLQIRNKSLEGLKKKTRDYI